MSALRAPILAMLCSTLPLSASEQSPADPAHPALKEVFKNHFPIGMGTQIVSGTRSDLLKKHASSATSENSLKPRPLRPSPDAWDWEQADRWLHWVESLGLQPIGHTLVWCYQMPDWLLAQATAGHLTREAALAWQTDHIHRTVSRYKDRIQIWDVVNEALSDSPEQDAPLLRSDPWSDLCGVDYIVQAFRAARAANPDATLVYNDYNLEVPAKRQRLFRLLEILRKEGCPPDAIGIQGHYTLYDPPVADLDAAIAEIHAAGYPVVISELDVSVYRFVPGANLQARHPDNPDTAGYRELPDELQQQLAERYREIFRVLIDRAPAIRRVSFWNVDDGVSWLNNWPVKGRPNHPLLFDARQNPKPAFHAVVELVAGSRTTHGTAPES